MMMLSPIKMLFTIVMQTSSTEKFIIPIMLVTYSYNLNPYPVPFMHFWPLMLEALSPTVAHKCIHLFCVIGVCQLEHKNPFYALSMPVETPSLDSSA